MEVDQIRFLNVVMEKTNQKLNELQARVIVLEAQLLLAAELNDKLVKETQRLNPKEPIKKSDY